MSTLRAVISNAAAKFSSAASREAACEHGVRALLAENGVTALSLKSIACEEPRRVYFGDAKIDGRTVTFIVSTDPRLGAIEGAVVSNVTAAQFQLLRYEWSYSIASCIRFYDYLIDRLNLHHKFASNAVRARECDVLSA